MRLFIAGAVALLLSGCASTDGFLTTAVKVVQTARGAITVADAAVARIDERLKDKCHYLADAVRIAADVVEAKPQAEKYIAPGLGLAASYCQGGPVTSLKQVLAAMEEIITGVRPLAKQLPRAPG